MASILGSGCCGRIAEILKDNQIDLRRVVYPDGIKDAGELLDKYGLDKAKQMFSEMMEQAASYSERASIERRAKKYDVPAKITEGQIEIRIEDRDYRDKIIVKRRPTTKHHDIFQ